MLRKNYDTKTLWSSVMFFIYAWFILCFLALGYLLFEDSIKDYLNRPTYSHEELLALSQKRARIVKSERANNWDLVENGIHVKTGLKDDEHLQLIIGSCTSCHSAKLITQNRATRQGWKNMIDWMQETQGLVDLGSFEPKILDYLAEHYAPEDVGRRQNLDIEEVKWYILNLEE